MKFNLALALTTFFALSVTATSPLECKNVLDEFKTIFDVDLDLSESRVSDLNNVLELRGLTDRIYDIEQQLALQCSDQGNAIKTDQELHLSYLAALEKIRDNYLNIFGASNVINSVTSIHDAVVHVIESMDKLVDFVYKWSGTTTDNYLKRLVNEILNYRDRVKFVIN